MGHDYIGHNYIGHDYVGHNYIGRTYIGHNYMGRSEFGPRALGHRSLLAVASDITVKDRLNIIKKRKWWRPVAPVVAAEAYFDVVHKGLEGSLARDWYVSLQKWR